MPSLRRSHCPLKSSGAQNVFVKPHMTSRLSHSHPSFCFLPSVPPPNSLHLMMQHATSPSRSSHDPEHSRGSKREAPDVLLPPSTLDHFSLLSCLHLCNSGLHLWTSLHLPFPFRFMETLLSNPLGALNPWRDRKRLLTTTHASCVVPYRIENLSREQLRVVRKPFTLNNQL